MFKINKLSLPLRVALLISIIIILHLLLAAFSDKCITESFKLTDKQIQEERNYKLLKDLKKQEHNQKRLNKIAVASINKNNKNI